MSGGARPKAKGSRFERRLCHVLSLWISKGKHNDLLWRSAMSGGRGTVRVAKHGAQRVSGDICSVGGEGHVLTDAFHIEAKHVKDMSLTAFALKGNGWLATEWKRCVRQAKSHAKHPMMIVKQNLCPTVVVLSHDVVVAGPSIHVPKLECSLHLFDDMLSRPYVMPRLPMPDYDGDLQERWTAKPLV